MVRAFSPDSLLSSTWGDAPHAVMVPRRWRFGIHRFRDVDGMIPFIRRIGKIPEILPKELTRRREEEMQRAPPPLPTFVPSCLRVKTNPPRITKTPDFHPTAPFAEIFLHFF